MQKLLRYLIEVINNLIFIGEGYVILKYLSYNFDRALQKDTLQFLNRIRISKV